MERSVSETELKYTDETPVTIFCEVEWKTLDKDGKQYCFLAHLIEQKIVPLKEMHNNVVWEFTVEWKTLEDGAGS